jgi:peptide subunit release factor 1 (eRF1)
MLRLSLTEVRKRLAQINPHIIIVGNYTNNRTPMQCRCRRHRLTWFARWDALAHGCGCPRCGRDKQIQQFKLPRTEIIKKLRAVNPKIELVGEYTGAHTKSKFRCRKCNHKWYALWCNLQRGHGCPKCAMQASKNGTRFTMDKVKRKLYHLNSKIKILDDEYKNSATGIHCLCLKCNYDWYPCWDTLQAKQRCPNCASKESQDAQRLSLDEVKRRVHQINPKITIVSAEYLGARSALKCKCVNCEHIWNSSWNRLDRSANCPKCGSQYKSEEEVRSIFERLTGLRWPQANPSEVPWLRGLYLDGYCRTLKTENYPSGTAFEYQGYQHYQPSHRHKYSETKLHEQKRRDWRKRIQCWRHGVRLIVIPHNVKNLHQYIAGRLIFVTEKTQLLAA